MRLKIILLLYFATILLHATAQPVQMLYDIYAGVPSSHPDYMTIFNGKLYFSVADAGNGRRLYSYDGIHAPVPLTTPGLYGEGSISLGQDEQMATLNNKLYFSAFDPMHGHELWSFDGVNTPALSADINPGMGNSAPVRLTVIGNRMFFNLSSIDYTDSLFMYDGINPPLAIGANAGIRSSHTRNFIGYNNRVYFSAMSDAKGDELHAYDLAGDTCCIVDDINPGSSSSAIGEIVMLNGKLYFTATTSTHGRELYSYDGSTILRLTDIRPGPDDGMNDVLVVYRNKLFFNGITTTGYEFYQYDPATSLASLAYDAHPGEEDAVSEPIVYNDKLYFVSSDSAHGSELWRYDGVTVSVVGDIYPGRNSSGISDMKIYNSILYMQATDGIHGAELFALKDPAGIQQVSFNGDVQVIPNPTSGDAVLQFSLLQPYQYNVVLTDVVGRPLWKNSMSGYNAGKHQIVIPLVGQGSGIYFYHVFNANGGTLAAGRIVIK